jgi:hypothetical protein
MIEGMSLRTLTTTIICFLTCCASPALGQSNIRGLPAGAVVVETRKLPSLKHQNRSLLLWMQNPKRNPSDYGSEEPIPCPDQTRGSYYSGPTRVSLLDSATNTIINTVKIVKEYEENDDSFDVPYAIRKGYYYHVEPPVKRTVEGRPTIMWLHDYNGDGNAHEFALFDALACMGLQTTLIGYSDKQDRVVQYAVHLGIIEGAKHSSRVGFWADYLFNKKPNRPGYWKYEIDYRGRAGPLEKWEVRYNATQERFEGKLIMESDQ